MPAPSTSHEVFFCKMIKIRLIPKIPPKIIDAVKKEDLVVFFGAGVSRIIGCPSWQGFAKAYLDQLLQCKLINHFEYDQLLKKDPRMGLTISQKILEESGTPPPNPSDVLKGDPQKISEYKIYDHLYKFKAIFVTTNFDDHMDAVVTKNMPRPQIQVTPKTSSDATPIPIPTKPPIFYAEDDLLITALSNGSLIHIHGSIADPKNLVITLPDYMRKYKTDTNHDVLLQEIFGKKTVLFMGYGLEEYDIIEFLVKKSKPVQGEIKHYMLMGAFEEEGNMMNLYGKYYRSLGIELLPFSKTKNGHAQLVNVIKNWAKEIGPAAASKPFIDKRKMIEEVD